MDYRVIHSLIQQICVESSTLLVAGDEGKNETKPLHSGSLGFTGEDRHVNMDSL